MRNLADRPDLCALNTATLGFRLPIHETIELVARAGFGGIAPWRREVEDLGAAAVGRLIRSAQLAVTGYCRSTYLPSSSRSEFEAALEDNRRAIADAALLGARSLVMVVGGLPSGSKDLAAARQQVEEGIGQLIGHARECGVRLALEPLHPVYAADRSCLNSIAAALDLVARFGPQQLGICLDVYHIWWDPLLSESMACCRGLITGFHVCDWLVPTCDPVYDRGMMGDGVIDIPSIRRDAEEAGYDGLIEVEIFSAGNWWKQPAPHVLEVCKKRLAVAC